jgi:hypothetical protein
MNRPTTVEGCADAAASLLPWFVNETLSAEDRGRVEAHLADCALCRAELAAERRIRTLLRQPEAVQGVPQLGLRKLLARIDEERPLAERPLAEGQHAVADVTPVHATHVAHSAPAPGLTRARRARRPWRTALTPWLAAAVVVEAIGLGVLGAQSAHQRNGLESASYSTMTAIAPSVTDGPGFRVVFTPGMTLIELRDVLRAQRLVVVAGPSEAGVFTLRLAGGATDSGIGTDALATLRADPRVRFAEPVARAGQ